MDMQTRGLRRQSLLRGVICSPQSQLAHALRPSMPEQDGSCCGRQSRHYSRLACEAVLATGTRIASGNCSRLHLPEAGDEDFPFLCSVRPPAASEITEK